MRKSADKKNWVVSETTKIFEIENDWFEVNLVRLPVLWLDLPAIRNIFGGNFKS
jgi:hypothetical protein